MWKTFFSVLKKHTKCLICLMISLSIILSPFSICFENLFSQAKSIIEEDPNYKIETDTVWTKQDSPYILNNLVIVASGTRLTIEPGTVVKLNDNIIVKGELIADIGIGEESAVFTSIYDDYLEDNSDWDDKVPSKGDWGSISVYPGGTLVLKNSVVKYGGLEKYYFVKENKPIKKNTAFAYDSSRILGAVTAYKAKKVQIEQSKFAHNLIGIQIYEVDNFVLNQSVISENDQGFVNMSEDELDVRHNDWGDFEKGPFHEELNSGGGGDIIVGNVLFDPWLGKPDEVVFKDPIIIVPGIVSSVLEDLDGEEVWPNILKMMTSIDDDYLEKLMLEDNGLPYTLVANNMKAVDILRKISNQDFFDGLIKELESIGYVENKDLFVFPYDWRYSVAWSAGDPLIANVPNLKDKIADVLDRTKKEQVNLIAHSMGGLLVKSYLERFGTSSVDKVIDIATPHLGSPKAFKVLTYGDDMGFYSHGFGLNVETSKNISQNFPAIYELLPSKKYFEMFSTEKEASFIADIYDFDENNIKGNLDYHESFETMVNMGRNSDLLEKAENMHAKIDDYNYDKTVNIVACGKATIGKVYILEKEKAGYKYALQYVDGDGTVPLVSADFLESQTIYTNLANHSFLPSAKGIKEFISSGFNDEDESVISFDNNPNISLFKKDVCGISGIQVSFHSPLEMHIYDKQGRHIGPNENGDLDMEIPNVSYDIIDDNKFVFIPKGLDFEIKGQATATGTFDVKISKVENNEYLKTAEFYDLPIETDQMKVFLKINDNIEESKLEIDQDGDEIIEKIYDVEKVNNGFVTILQEVQEYKIQDLPDLIQTEYQKGEIKRWVYFILKNRVKSIIKQIENAEKNIDRIIQKLDGGKIKGRWVKIWKSKLEELKKQNKRLIDRRWEAYLKTVKWLTDKNYISDDFYDIIKNVKLY